MQSENTKSKDGIATLLEAFQKKDALSTENIQELLDCNRQSVNNYLHRLKELGYPLHKETKNRKAFYSLADCENLSETPLFHPLTQNHLRKYTIMSALQNGPIKKEDLKKHFVLPNCKTADLKDSFPLDVNQTSFYNLRNELENEGEITLNKIDSKYYISPVNIPFCLSLDEDSVSQLAFELSTMPPGSLYHKQFQSITRKLNALLGCFDDDTEYQENYLIYGKCMNGMKNIADKFTLFNKVNYKHRLLDITYIPKKEPKQNLRFATGLLVYSVEKDTFYAIGRRIGNDTQSSEQTYIILRVDSIQSVHETTQENQEYRSEYYLNMFDNMFSISVEPPVDVGVEFEAFGNIPQKIRQLAKHRKNGKCEEITRSDTSTVLLYTDKISGLDDFAAYLRTFGKSARVLFPQELKERMCASAKLSLKNYQEADNELH